MKENHKKEWEIVTMSRRRNKRGKKYGGSPTWITTFSDVMSLLLTFFILLYSMSNLDAQKFQEMTKSLQGVLSGLGYTEILEGQDSTMELPTEGEISAEDVLETSSLKDEIKEVYEKVSDYVEAEGLDAVVTVNYNKRGIFVDIKEAILFDSASPDIKASGVEVLKKIEGILKEFENEIVIEGHTDDVPMQSALYPSNWELSTGRSVSVARYLSEKGNIPPNRLSAVGYGEYKPIVPNTSEENRAINRRVNILIIFDEKSDKE